MVTIEQIYPEYIHLDGGTQPRAKIDEAVWREYGERMKAGDKFRPIIVFFDGKEYWLVDGFHRHRASSMCLPGEAMECEVHQGTLEDAQWYSYTVNRDHGLRRTNADKERAVRAALAHPKSEGLSNCQIAEYVGVDEITVRRHRKKTATSTMSKSDGTSTMSKSDGDGEGAVIVVSGPEEGRPRTGRDGRTINTSKIGRKSRRPRSPAEYAQAKQEGRRVRFPSMVKLELPNNHVRNCAYDLLEYFTFEYLAKVFEEMRNIHQQRCQETADE